MQFNDRNYAVFKLKDRIFVEIICPYMGVLVLILDLIEFLRIPYKESSLFLATYICIYNIQYTYI